MRRREQGEDAINAYTAVDAVHACRICGGASRARMLPTHTRLSMQSIRALTSSVWLLVLLLRCVVRGVGENFWSIPSRTCMLRRCYNQHRAVVTWWRLDSCAAFVQLRSTAHSGASDAHEAAMTSGRPHQCYRTRRIDGEPNSLSHSLVQMSNEVRVEL